MQSESRILVWDLATRLFHWTLAGGFIAAATISLVLGDDSPLFPYHAIVGLTLVLMVGLRVAWGVVGTRYARFGSFAFGPSAIIEYSRGVLTGKGMRHIGHNPGSSLAIFLMLAIILGLGATGFMLGTGNESVKEIHELLSYSMLGVVAVHILGVIIHSVRHRENITASMVHGRKSGDPSASIKSAQPIAGVAFLLIVGAWAFGLVRAYDPATMTTRLPLLGTTLTLGENESEEGEEGEEGEAAGERGAAGAGGASQSEQQEDDDDD